MGSGIDRGTFLTLEGGEGAGKSTLLKGLQSALEDRGYEVVLTREPGGSPLAERTRDQLLAGTFKGCGAEAEALIFALARSDHISKTIKPALDRGAIVLCDRFFDSTRAYQGASGGVDGAFLDRLEEEAAGDCRPDITLILDLPVSVGRARAAARRGEVVADRFESEGSGFHEAVRQGFLDIARRDPARCRVLDAEAPPSGVLDAALSALDTRLSVARSYR